MRLLPTHTSYAALGLLILAASSRVQAFPGETKYLASKALKEYEAGNYDQAANLYTQAAKKSPDSSVLKYDLGATYLKSGNLPKALETFKSVFDPKDVNLNAAARYNAGLANHTTARKAMEAVTKADHSDKAYLAARDTAMKSLQTASEDYRAAILSSPYDNDIKYNYELAQRELQQLQEEQQREQQQQQQQQQKDQQQQQSKDQQKDQQQQQQKQDQQKQDQQKQDQQQQQQQQQQQKQDQQQDQQKNQQQQQQQPQNGDQQKDDPQKQDKQDQGDKPKDDQQQKDQQKPGDQQQQPKQGDPKDQKDQEGSGKQGPQQEMTPEGEMSPQDVERLLNSLPPEDREALQRFYQVKPRAPQDMERDW